MQLPSSSSDSETESDTTESETTELSGSVSSESGGGAASSLSQESINYQFTQSENTASNDAAYDRFCRPSENRRHSIKRSVQVLLCCLPLYIARPPT